MSKVKLGIFDGHENKVDSLFMSHYRLVLTPNFYCTNFEFCIQFIYSVYRQADDFLMIAPEIYFQRFLVLSATLAL